MVDNGVRSSGLAVTGNGVLHPVEVAQPVRELDGVLGEAVGGRRDVRGRPRHARQAGGSGRAAALRVTVVAGGSRRRRGAGGLRLVEGSGVGSEGFDLVGGWGWRKGRLHSVGG
jgi:hypothetical protein